MSYNINVEDNPPEIVVESDLGKIIIYPHSVMVSRIPVKAKEVYKELLGKSLFTIYMSIYSTEIDKNYVIDLNVIDLLEVTEGSERRVFFESLEGEGFKLFIDSILMIFEPFERNVLNFEKRQHSMLEYLNYIKEWIPEPGDSNNDFISEK